MSSSTEKPFLLLGPTAIHGYGIVCRYPDQVQAVHNTNQKDAKRLGWPYVELEDLDGITALLANYTGTILYAHAVCDVRRCEQNPEWARRKNVDNLAHALRSSRPDARFVYLSSDHLFGEDGVYDEDSEPCPISEYGRTRIEAEALVSERENTVIIRVPLALGPSVSGRIGHLDWIRYRHTKGLPITIIEDEARSAVSARDAAERILAIAESPITGVRHIAAPSVSRIELADAVYAHHGLTPDYTLATRADQPAPHLGRVTMATCYNDAWSLPVASAVDVFSPAHII